MDIVLNCNLGAAWSLQSDFMALPSWVPTITVSRLLEGEPNAVGCLRYCKGSSTTWVHERLLELDHANHFMSYRMEDNHFVFPEGFQGYVAKVQVSPVYNKSLTSQSNHMITCIRPQYSHELGL